MVLGHLWRSLAHFHLLPFAGNAQDDEAWNSRNTEGDRLSSYSAARIDPGQFPTIDAEKDPKVGKNCKTHIHRPIKDSLISPVSGCPAHNLLCQRYIRIALPP